MEIGELFGWVQTVLEQLGVWTTLGVLVKMMLVVTATTFVFRWFRG